MTQSSQLRIVVSDDHPVLGMEAMLSLITPHPRTDFDEEQFLGLLQKSIILTLGEKVRVLEKLPQFSQTQLDSLTETLWHEKEKFEFLAEEFPGAVAELVKARQEEVDSAVRNWKRANQVPVAPGMLN